MNDGLVRGRLVAMNDVTNTWSEPLLDALRIIAKRCPRLCANCYWSGTAAIAIEELEHRQSLDLDFHTRSA